MREAPSSRATRLTAGAERTPHVELIDELQRRWTLPILLCLNKGAQRFSDLRAALPGLASNVLSKRLRALERAGLVAREALPPPAARQVYQLGSLGEGLKAALDALEDWQQETESYAHW